jgi:hypothetical protein
LTSKLPANLVIAAGARQYGPGLVRPAPDALGDDVVAATLLEIGAVLPRVEARVRHPHHPVQHPTGQVVLIVLMIAWSDVVPGKVQQRIGIPSAVTAMPRTTWGQVWPVVLGVLGEAARRGLVRPVVLCDLLLGFLLARRGVELDEGVGDVALKVGR